MERQIITVGSNGQLVLPQEVQAALHLEPGSAIEISIEHSRVILNPVNEATSRGKLPANVLALRGLFAGGRSLEDTLLGLRRSDQW